MITVGSLVEVPLLLRTTDWVTPYVLSATTNDNTIIRGFCDKSFKTDKLLSVNKAYFYFVLKVSGIRIIPYEERSITLFEVLVPKIYLSGKLIVNDLAYVFEEHCTEFTGKLCTKCGFACRQNCNIITKL